MERKYKKKFWFFIPCQEANHTCDKTQYNEASIWEKIKLSIHLLYCGACRKYTKNNTSLTKSIKEGNVISMNMSEKQSLEELFKKELSKNL